MASTSKKQNALSIKTKIDILKAVDVGGTRRTKTDICKEFGIPNSTLSTILRNREKINLAYEGSSFEPGRKRLRMAKHGALDSALLLWFKQARSQNIPISGPILGEMAELLAKCMGIEFKSNPGWIERFKSRNGIVFICISEKTLAFRNEIRSVKQNSQERVSLENHINLDDVIDSDPLATEREISPVVISSPLKPTEVSLQAIEEVESVDVMPIPSASEIRQSLRNIRRFLEQAEDGVVMYRNLEDLDLYFHQKFLAKTVQRKITDYFTRK